VGGPQGVELALGGRAGRLRLAALEGARAGATVEHARRGAAGIIVAYQDRLAPRTGSARRKADLDKANARLVCAAEGLDGEAATTR
jgi:hypothetical protein